MNQFDKFEDPRRRTLIQALTAGLFSAGLPLANFSNALAQSAFGDRPTRLPSNKSIYRLVGSASVNGTPANMDTIIRVGDTVETGKDSELVFVVGSNSMILRSDCKLVIEGDKKESDSWLITGCRLLAGKLLSASRNTNMVLTTTTATVGIRGTGWYAESDPEQTYFCTCYGRVDVAATHDPQARETVTSKYHDRPLYILGKSAGAKAIRNAPFINHTDQELMLIEALVGRTPPFVFSKDSYSGPRRGY